MVKDCALRPLVRAITNTGGNKMNNLFAVSKDNNWQDGTTTIWFAQDVYEDAVWGVVFSGTDDPVLVDCNGVPAEGQHDAVGVLKAIEEKANQALIDL